MNKTVYIFVNGILTWPGNSRNWNSRAVTFTHLETLNQAEKFEYVVGPVSRVFGQKKRAKKLIDYLDAYEGRPIVLAGHSNGCDVICDALKQRPSIRIKALHLISAACDPDFGKNGINEIDAAEVVVWIAGKDKALTLANLRISRLLGYGVLGKTGPIKARPGLNCQIITRQDYGHSDWFTDTNFRHTLSRIVNIPDPWIHL